jgi:hypothetical protein
MYEKFLNIFLKNLTEGMDSLFNQGKVRFTDDEQTRRIKWGYV